NRQAAAAELDQAKADRDAKARVLADVQGVTLQSASPQGIQQQAVNTAGVAQQQTFQATAPEVTGCADQGFGDLVDVAMDETGLKAWTINRHGQVYYTTDGGKRWGAETLPDLRPDEALMAIATTPAGDRAVMAVESREGSYRFYQRKGESWQA